MDFIHNHSQLFKSFVFQTFPAKLIQQSTWASFVIWKGKNSGSPILQFLDFVW